MRAESDFRPDPTEPDADGDVVFPDDGEVEPVVWTADEAGSGERLDRLLAERVCAGVSRSRIQQWIRDGRVLVNGAVVKPNYRVAAGDAIEIAPPPPEPTDIRPEPIPLDVVYEDEDVVVVDKPRGLVVHPAPGHMSGTLVNALVYHCKDLAGVGDALRPGLVHRLDKDTSGLLVVAKNDRAYASLVAQWKARTIARRYVALVEGVVAHDVGTIDAPVGRDPRDRLRFAVTKGGKPAVTHFRVAERFRAHTMLELRLETGRTHQIRVHLKYIGHPVVGDPLYGRPGRWPIAGQALHAAELGFDHPRDGRRMTFVAPLPDDMRRLVEAMRSEF